MILPHLLLIFSNFEESESMTSNDTNKKNKSLIALANSEDSNKPVYMQMESEQSMSIYI